MYFGLLELGTDIPSMPEASWLTLLVLSPLNYISVTSYCELRRWQQQVKTASCETTFLSAFVSLRARCLCQTNLTFVSSESWQLASLRPSAPLSPPLPLFLWPSPRNLHKGCFPLEQFHSTEGKETRGGQTARTRLHLISHTIDFIQFYFLSVVLAKFWNRTSLP